MIQFSHVYKTYPGPIHALRDASFFIEKGEMVFLTGPSGAGKTTLFRMLSAFDRPTSGAVDVNGYDLTQISGRQIAHFRRHVGVVFQDFKLLKDRTVLENVRLPLEIRGERESFIERKTEELLTQVGLWFKREQLPEQLSGGEQQRVAIARALIHQPGVLIADEPTGNLDRDLSFEILDLLEKVNAQGTTIFIATHDLDLVQRKARRVLQIERGELRSGEAGE